MNSVRIEVHLFHVLDGGRTWWVLWNPSDDRIFKGKIRETKKSVVDRWLKAYAPAFPVKIIRYKGYCRISEMAVAIAAVAAERRKP